MIARLVETTLARRPQVFGSGPLTCRPACGLAWAARVLARSLALAAVFGVFAPGTGESAGAAGGDKKSAARWTHALATFGEPKYPRGFDHFEYVNPDAPKRGMLYLGNPDRRSSFDKLNPYTLRGSAPAGLAIFMFETLAIMSGDEPSTMYGLLAEEMLAASDKSSITFRLHPKARFSNGDPVTAEDVRHSFETLTGKFASPAVRAAFSAVKQAVVLDARTVRFDLNERNIAAMITVGTELPVFSRKWGAGPDGKAKPFDQIVTEHPLTSGPYTIAVADSGRRIELARDPGYWARDLGVRRGTFNFERIVYRYYKDGAVRLEAFKAGEFDLVLEYSARRWARQHAGPKWRDGRIVKRDFRHGLGEGGQFYLLNLRRPLFADVRVREAIGYSYDFDSIINSYRQYKRLESRFANSTFAATGLPGPGELKLLEPFRSQLPPKAFGLPWQAPRTDAGSNALRENLLKARDLLAQAGWKIAADGVLRNASGEPFEFEYMSTDDGVQRVVAAWQRNLDKLGIRIKVRQVDFALYRKRIEKFDYDMVVIVSGAFTLPDGVDLLNAYGSKNADIEGSQNYLGLKNPVLDRLIDAVIGAQTLDDLRDSTRAFDRVFMYGHYGVADLYAPNYRVSYWNKFGIPAVTPAFFTIDTGSTLPVWPLTAWWSKDAAPR